MVLKINTDVLDRYKIKPSTFLMCLAIKQCQNIGFNKVLASIKDHYYTKLDDPGNYHLTPETNDLINTILKESEKPPKRKVQNMDALVELANQMRECFPKGDKIINGTPYPWRESAKATAIRLDTFIKTYGQFTPEQILQATKNYVAKHENDPLMRTLKYFIWRNEKDFDAFGRPCIIRKSDLDTELANIDEEVPVANNAFGDLIV